MYSDKDKIYLQTSDIPKLKNKIKKAIDLANELSITLNDLENYNIEFEIGTKNK